jgi:hypothetical protein
MPQKENKIWKFIGIALAIYMIIWFWPVVFHRPFFNNYYYDNPYVSARPGAAPSIVVTPIQTAPGDHPEFEDGVIYTGGYTEPKPIEPAPEIPIGVACTMDAKECPDGSYVGRTGPNCEFSPCPGN